MKTNDLHISIKKEFQLKKETSYKKTSLFLWIFCCFSCLVAHGPDHGISCWALTCLVASPGEVSRIESSLDLPKDSLWKFSLMCCWVSQLRWYLSMIIWIALNNSNSNDRDQWSKLSFSVLENLFVTFSYHCYHCYWRELANPVQGRRLVEVSEENTIWLICTGGIYKKLEMIGLQKLST